MSGWVHKCRNDADIVVLHGDLSGDVWVRSADGEQEIVLPAADLVAVVAAHVRNERDVMAEQSIANMSVCELLGIRPQERFEPIEED